MKTFDQYKDGDWIVLTIPGHQWHGMQFQAYKSQWTHDAFRLKFGAREMVADISEIRPVSESNNVLKETYANLDTDLRSNAGQPRSQYGNDDFDYFGQD